MSLEEMGGDAAPMLQDGSGLPPLQPDGNPTQRFKEIGYPGEGSHTRGDTIQQKK